MKTHQAAYLRAMTQADLAAVRQAFQAVFEEIAQLKAALQQQYPASDLLGRFTTIEIDRQVIEGSLTGFEEDVSKLVELLDELYQQQELADDAFWRGWVARMADLKRRLPPVL